MTRTPLFHIAFWLLPTIALAQMDEFKQEFLNANQRYLSERTIMVTQHYLFALDSAAAVPFDSSYCYIEKNDRMMHYQFNGMELFSDGAYQIRISNPGKYLVVSRSNHADSSAPGLIFSKGLSSFKNVEKKNIGGELSEWKLTGGTYGVLAVDIIFDTRESRIRNILAELSPDHPFVSQINTPKSGRQHNVFIRIDYAYTTKLSNGQPQLSDYIVVRNDKIVAAEKYRDYQMKVIK